MNSCSRLDKAALPPWSKWQKQRAASPFTPPAKTLSRYREGILAWYGHPISTGPLEGTNNKIKTLKRQAYGFRDAEYFALKIKALHHSRFELIG